MNFLTSEINRQNYERKFEVYRKLYGIFELYNVNKMELYLTKSYNFSVS